MTNSEVINIANTEIDKLSLTKDYRTRGPFYSSFNDHLSRLINLNLSINNDPNFILRQKELKMNKELYWELEANALEKIDDIQNDSLLDKLDQLEDRLNAQIIKKLGAYYHNISEIIEVINYSVNAFVLNHKYKCMGSALSKNFENPWIPSASILNNNGYLHSFVNQENLTHYVKIKEPRLSSELTNKRIGVIGKGRHDKFTGTYIRDLFGLRNHLNNMIEELAPSARTPIKTDRIIANLRSQGIPESDLSDSHIKSWLIRPLKVLGKIGSCKEGYFYIGTCSDLKITYLSHLENMKGYLRTLNNYKKMASTLDCQEQDFFKKHQTDFDI